MTQPNRIDELSQVQDSEYFLDLTLLINNLVTEIKDKNNKLISEFRFIEKDEYGPYRPYRFYDVADPEKTIIAVKLWLYMLFKKSYTFKHINKEYIKVFIQPSTNKLPYVYLGLSKNHYNKLIHPKNLGQFKDLREGSKLVFGEGDLCIKLYVNDKDVDVKNIYKYSGSISSVENPVLGWVELITSITKFEYYSYKFNPFVFL